MPCGHRSRSRTAWQLHAVPCARAFPCQRGLCWTYILYVRITLGLYVVLHCLQFAGPGRPPHCHEAWRQSRPLAGPEAPPRSACALPVSRLRLSTRSRSLIGWSSRPCSRRSRIGTGWPMAAAAGSMMSCVLSCWSPKSASCFCEERKRSL